MQVFLSGGTGYVGRALVAKLIERGHRARVLARPGSEHKVPAGAEAVPGNPLDPATFSAAVSAGDTFVQLTGVAHPAGLVTLDQMATALLWAVENPPESRILDVPAIRAISGY